MVITITVFFLRLLKLFSLILGSTDKWCQAKSSTSSNNVISMMEHSYCQNTFKNSVCFDTVNSSLTFALGSFHLCFNSSTWGGTKTTIVEHEFLFYWENPICHNLTISFPKIEKDLEVCKMQIQKTMQNKKEFMSLLHHTFS